MYALATFPLHITPAPIHTPQPFQETYLWKTWGFPIFSFQNYPALWKTKYTVYYNVITEDIATHLTERYMNYARCHLRRWNSAPRKSSSHRHRLRRPYHRRRWWG